MTTLDFVLLVLVALYAITGLRQGFVVGLFSTLGLVVGAVVGIFAVPRLFQQFEPSTLVAVGTLVAVLVCMGIGQAAGSYLGVALRGAISWRPARTVDSVGGAVLSAATALVVLWMLGIVVSAAQIGQLSGAVQSSRVLREVDRVMPGTADDALGALTRVVDSNVFPRYLDPFIPERIVPADPPTRAVLRDPDIRRAAGSVVKIVSSAQACDRGVEGSGFVYAPGRVLTNAHVVAGSDNPTVLLDGQRHSARTVVYDPELDLAVLAVDGLDADALSFDGDGSRGDQGAVLGYPQNGPFDAEPARIRSEQRLRSSDIYGDGQVVRHVFSVYAHVLPGNSGGPLVSADGEVYGVVFAASVKDDRTAYVITAEQAAGVAQQGRDARGAVSTGGCA